METPVKLLLRNATHAWVEPWPRKLLPKQTQLLTALAKPTTTLLELPAHATLVQLVIYQPLDR